MLRPLLPLTGLLLAGALLSSAARAGDLGLEPGYGPGPSGRFVTPYDGSAPPVVAYRASRVGARRGAGPIVRAYPELEPAVPPQPYVVVGYQEPSIGRGLLYNTPPTPDAYGIVRARY